MSSKEILKAARDAYQTTGARRNGKDWPSYKSGFIEGCLLEKHNDSDNWENIIDEAIDAIGGVISDKLIKWLDDHYELPKKRRVAGKTYLDAVDFENKLSGIILNKK